MAAKRFEMGDAGPHLRQLEAKDAVAIQRHLLALSAADRRARFLSYASDAAIAAYAHGLHSSRAILVGAFDRDSHLIGLAEAHPAEALRAVEIGITIEPTFRRRGLGRRLVARAMALAFARGAQSAQFHFAPWNLALAGLVNSLGGGIKTAGYAEICRPATGADLKAA